MSDRTASNAARAIAFGALAIAAGGLLLGIQLDANGALAGTGFASLGIGALLALGAALARGTARLPRDLLGYVATISIFVALSFVVAGVLVPGGPWMFAQVAILLALVALRPAGSDATRVVGRGGLVLLSLFLFFKLWICYQGSESRWQMMSLGVPVLSWLPFEFLKPVQSVSLGSFTPYELGFPPAGLSFGATALSWALGFASTLGGLMLVQHGAREHENDRVDALIHTLPPAVARVIERLVPEEEWETLGLHRLSERRLARRIERLVGERVVQRAELERALEAGRTSVHDEPDGFTRGVLRALAEPRDAARDDA